MSPFQRRDTQGDVLAIILAGGQGERLYPLTRDRAKPAVPFGAAYRIIDFTLSNCLNSGLRRVYVLTQYKSLSLERHIRQGWHVFSEALGEFIVPIPPQQRLGGSWYQGTADAIFQNIYTLERERPQHVLVLSGDHVYKMDYAAMISFHRERGADLTVACIEVARDEASHLGVAVADEQGRMVEWQEKPAIPAAMPGKSDRCLASMGVYVFRTEALVRRVSQDARRDSAHDFGKDVIPAMIETDGVYAYSFADPGGKDRPYWRDIGRIDAYYDAHRDLLSPRPAFDLHDPAWPIRTRSRHYPPVKVLGAGGEILVEDSLVAPGSILSGGGVVRSVLGYGVRVENLASVSDSILLDGVVVEQGAQVSHSIIDKGVRIPAGARIGFDREEDESRFTVTERGVVVVPKEQPIRA